MNDYNKILNRTEIEKDIKNRILHFEENKKDLSIKRGFYLYGNSGVGKTQFIINILKDLNYDIIYYDSSDVRNKKVINELTNNNISDKNILSMFQKKERKIVYLMDDIYSMCNGDKSGLSTLTKLIRPKKTKKQKNESYTMNLFICIGNYHMDKKIKLLMNVCNIYEIHQPNDNQVIELIKYNFKDINKDIIENIKNYINYDLKKLKLLKDIYNENNNILKNNSFINILQTKVNNEYIKDNTRHLINEKISINDHNIMINDNDRTSLSLLYHENIIDFIKKNNIHLDDYIKILDDYCYSDYIDRITFQKQIWLFNEVTSLIKLVKTNNNIHKNNINQKLKKDDIRFTKILTKYATEYNNTVFINELCQKLSMDKKDLYTFFLNLKDNYDMNTIIELLYEYEITKLDINRIFTFIDKYTLYI
jgi:hypothetical protein